MLRRTLRLAFSNQKIVRDQTYESMQIARECYINKKRGIFGDASDLPFGNILNTSSSMKEYYLSKGQNKVKIYFIYT